MQVLPTHLRLQDTHLGRLLRVSGQGLLSRFLLLIQELSVDVQRAGGQRRAAFAGHSQRFGPKSRLLTRPFGKGLFLWNWEISAPFSPISLHHLTSVYFTRFLKADPKIKYWVFPPIVPSFCPQKKGQSS
jgi:hypothetical protein